MTTPRAALAAALTDMDTHHADAASAGYYNMEWRMWPVEDIRDAILAALAERGYAVTRSEAGLDVERLLRVASGNVARRQFPGQSGGIGWVINIDGKQYDLDVAAVFAEYARLAADPEPSDA